MLFESKRWEVRVNRKVWVLAFVCALGAVSALASGIEVTPTVGYRFEGEFNHLSVDGTSAKLQLDDAEEYGIIVSFPVTKRVDFEVRWSRQDVDVSSSLPFAPAPQELTNDTILGGLLVYFPVDHKVVKPFMNFEMGTTQFDADNGFSAESGFAFAVGGGSKFLFSDHFGVRVQGSYLSSNVPAGRDIFCRGDGRCYTGTSRNSVNQFELTTGFIFRF